MALARHRLPFHFAVAVVSLVLPILLPYAAAVAKESTDAPHLSTLAAVPVFSDHRLAPASPSNVARRKEEHDTAGTPSPQAAPAPTRPAHPRTRDTYYGVFFADLHDACLRQNCRADYFYRLSWMLYGPRADDEYIYCVVRSIQGWQPILPGSWRAAVPSASGGDTCYVEVARTFRIHCWAWSCSRRCTTYPDVALSFAIDAISTPCGGVTSSSSSAAPSPLNAALLNAVLPLLAVAFLPRPLAAAVVLSYLPSLARAGRLSEEGFLKLNHATCAVYAYDSNTGVVEPARPVPGLREMWCLRPLCFDGDASNKHNDPLRIYCVVHSLEGASSPSIFFPWRNTWRAHLPISDPDAAADTGDDVCFVELAHMDYRERYYISCPAGDGHARLSCTEFPEEAVASAVREHRKLNYVVPNCDSYMYGAADPLFGGYDYDADL